MKRFQSLFVKVSRFCITGGIGMIVDFSVTALGKEYFKINPYAANFTGIFAALIVIFLLHKNWTFPNTDKKISRQFQLFLVVSVLGCLWNSGFLYLLQDRFSLSFYVAKAFAIILVGVWNFSANYMITFRSCPVLPEL